MSDIEFSVLEAQQNIHELIAQQHPLEQTLDGDSRLGRQHDARCAGFHHAISSGHQQPKPDAQRPIFRSFFPGHAGYSGG